MEKNCFNGLVVGLLLMLLMAPVSKVTAEAVPPQQTTVNTDDGKAYLKVGFTLMKETIGPLALGMSADDVLAQLGKPEKKSEAKIWDADKAEHQFWYYPTKGIELGMIERGGRQDVERIVIKDSCDYENQRGIKLGSSAMAVQAAYQDVINPRASRPGKQIVCGTIYGGIIFDLQNDAVSSIFIGAAAE